MWRKITPLVRIPIYFANNSAYFDSLMREFPFDKKWTGAVTMQNELGNSVRLELSLPKCKQFFMSLVRQTGDKIPNIPESSWRGYVFIKTDLTVGCFSAVNSPLHLAFQMGIFPLPFSLLFAVMILHLYGLKRPISLLINHLSLTMVLHFDDCPINF